MKKVLITVLIIAVAVGAYFVVRSASMKKEAETARIDLVENNKKAADFLLQAKAFFVATVDAGGQPRVRPFSMVEIVDGKIAICTGSKKDVYRQIADGKSVEISAVNPELNRWIRISGKLVDSTTDAAHAQFMKNNPSLYELYQGREDELRILTFEGPAAAIFQDFADNIEKLSL